MSRHTDWQARRAYKEGEAQFRDRRARKLFVEARSVLDRMIAVVEGSRRAFDEPIDRIRVLKARKATLSCEEHRLSGGLRLPAMLREAARLSTPAVCDPKPCAVDENATPCATPVPPLSRRQAEMCVQRLTLMTHALKIEAAFAARTFDYRTALEKRRLARTIHQSVLRLDKTRPRLVHQAYLDYWFHITSGYVALLAGTFAEARASFGSALECARDLEEAACFPNYFRSRAELAAHQHYVSAVERVAAADFAGASLSFRAWLDAAREVGSNLRWENTAILAAMCDILARLPAAGVPEDEWRVLERLLQHRYAARTTWALWRRLEWLRALAFKTSQGDTTALPALRTEVAAVANDWRLFCLDAVLLGADRVAGLERPVNYPSVVDILDYLDPSVPDWRPLLVQNLRHVLLLIADYEWSSSVRRGLGSPSPDSSGWATCVERKPFRQLADAVLGRLSGRSKLPAEALAKARGYLDGFVAAVNTGNYVESTGAYLSFLDVVRRWPHVVHVEEQVEEPYSVFVDKDQSEFLVYRSRLRRLCSQPPYEMEVEGPQWLKVGSYYYLRPGWNVRRGVKYRVRHEKLYEARIPRWIEVFADNLVGRGKVPPDRFREWIVQFQEDERLLACRLLAGLEIYSEPAVRDLWAAAFRQLPPTARREAVFVGLGHGAKSGPHALYLFRQGISRLPEYETLFSGRERHVFRDLAEFEEHEQSMRNPSIVVFLDDFIGTGGQASRLIKSHFVEHTWLGKAEVFLCVLVGFRAAIETVVERQLSGLLKRTIAARILEDRDRAFSPENLLWSSPEEAETARAWAEELGCQLLEGVAGYDPSRDALGWHGCQALVSFHHNVPNDTLPLFWATGNLADRAWKPLLDRFD